MGHGYLLLPVEDVAPPAPGLARGRRFAAVLLLLAGAWILVIGLYEVPQKAYEYWGVRLPLHEQAMSAERYVDFLPTHENPDVDALLHELAELRAFYKLLRMET